MFDKLGGVQRATMGGFLEYRVTIRGRVYMAVASSRAM
jgi:hypothetical protein